MASNGPDLSVEGAAVRGFRGSVLEAIEREVIPRPELMDFNSWQRWRRTYGRRPLREFGGQGTPALVEGRWWREVMEALYGDTWRLDLENRVLEEASQLAEGETEGRGRQATRASSTSRPPIAPVSELAGRPGVPEPVRGGRLPRAAVSQQSLALEEGPARKLWASNRRLQEEFLRWRTPP